MNHTLKRLCFCLFILPWLIIVALPYWIITGKDAMMLFEHWFITESH